MKAPIFIYLQGISDAEVLHGGDVTWCDDKIEDDDVAYILKAEADRAHGILADRLTEVRADCDKLQAENAKLTEALHGAGCEMSTQSIYVEDLERENDRLRKSHNEMLQLIEAHGNRVTQVLAQAKQLLGVHAALKGE